MSSYDAPAGASAPGSAGLIAAAQDGVREAVAAGGSSSRPGHRWVVPVAAAAAVAAAACTPVAWPLLAGGALVGQAALAAAFGQVGAVGSGLLSEAVIRAWDRLRKREGADVDQSELREALAAELTEALTSPSFAAAGLRAEVAGVLQRVDAIKVALTTTVGTSAGEAGDQVRAVLIRGLRDLGTRFTEFGWLLGEVSDQLTRIAEAQTEIAAGSRAMLEAQQRTLMQLALLRQQTQMALARGGRPGEPTEITAAHPDQERAAALDAAGVPASLECPYPGLASYQPQDADQFFGREQLTAVLITRLAEQLIRPGLLMVLGPSGSGKSSLLRAGLLPAVAAGGLPARDSDSWPLDLMTPGRRPLLELAVRLAALARIPAGAVESDLRTDPGRITATIRQALIVHSQRHATWSWFDRGGTSGATRPFPVAPPGTRLQADDAARAGRRSGFSRAREVPAGRLVLVVDQFEELFTQCTDEQERRTFIQALCSAAGVTSPQVSPSVQAGGIPRPRSPQDAQALVVIGLRADFYARSAAYSQLAPYLQDCQVLVGPMDENGLRAAIEEPAARAGLVVDAGLTEVMLADLGLRVSSADRLIFPAKPGETTLETIRDAGGAHASQADTGYEAGRLPLLAYALEQTWKHREGRRLTVRAYQAVGGIDGSVALAADTVYERLDADGRLAARRLLLRMVSLGEGTADTRRRVTVTELTGTATQTELPGPAEGLPDATAGAVLADLIRARLVTADTGASGMETVQISHEALLSAWPRFRLWLSQDRAGQRIHRDLTEGAHAWRAQDRDPSRLFTGTRLGVAQEWADGHEQDLNADERAFLAACWRRERRGLWVRRTVVAALAGLLIATLAGGALAVRAAKTANQQRDLALSSQLAVQSEALDASDPVRAALLAAAAAHFDLTPQVRDSLLDISAQPERAVLTAGSGPVPALAFGQGGKLLATASQTGITLWDVAAHRQIGRPMPAGSDVDALAFSRDGKMLASVDANGLARMWDVLSHREVGAPLKTGKGISDALTSSSSGLRLATATDTGTIRCWNLRTRRQIGAPIETGVVYSLTLNSAGTLVGAATASGGRVWDIATGMEQSQPSGGANGPDRVVFSPDGKLLAAVNGGGAVLSDIATGQSTGPAMPAEGGMLEVAAFSADGTMLATGGAGGFVYLWDTADHRRAGVLQAGVSQISAMAFSPVGNLLAVVNDAGQVQLLDTAVWRQMGTPIVVGDNQNVLVEDMAVSPDSKTVAIGENGGKTWLVDIATRRRLAVLAPSIVNNDVLGGIMAFSPDGKILAIENGDGTIQLWNTATRRKAGKLSFGSEGVGDLIFSPDGRTLAVATAGRVSLVNFSTGRVAALLVPSAAGSASRLLDVRFTSDGKNIITVTPYIVQLWNVADHRELGRFQIAKTDTPTNQLGGPEAFSSDGNTLAIATNGIVQLWDVISHRQIGAPLNLGTVSGYPTAMAFSSDGSLLAAAIGTTVSLWDVQTRQEVGVPIGFTSVGVNFPEGLSFSPDGRTLAAFSQQNIWLWNITLPKNLAMAACSIAGHPFTPEEWNLYVPSEPFQKVC
jgi:WD40 repeat protein